MDLLLGSYELKELKFSNDHIKRYFGVQQPLGRKVEIIIHKFSNAREQDKACQAVLNCGKVSHPNLAAVVDVAKNGLELIVVLEFLEGKPLMEWLSESAPLARWQIEQIFYQMAQAINVLATHDLIFGDIKPSYFFIVSTSDNKKLLKVVLGEASDNRPGFKQISRQLAALGLKIATGRPDYTPSSPEELKNLAPTADEDWLNHLYDLYKGENMPAGWDELLQEFAKHSTTLSMRRDTWTLGTASGAVELPSRSNTPIIISSLVIILLVLVGAFFFLMPKDEEKKFNGPKKTLAMAMSVSLSGLNREIGISYREGILSAIGEYNKKNEPYEIKLKALDDGYNAQLAEDNVKKLLKDNPPVILGVTGTAATAQTRAMVLNNKSLFFAPLSGADFLHRVPPEELVYTYRPRYSNELETLINYLAQNEHLDPKRVAVFYQEGPFGTSGLIGVNKALKALGVSDPKQLPRASYIANSLDVSAAAATFLAARDKIDTIIAIATYDPLANLVQQLDDGGFHPHFVTMSIVGTEALAELLKEFKVKKFNITISQLVPDYRTASPIAREYNAAVNKYSEGGEADSTSFEGYLATRLFLAALNKIESGPVSGTTLSKALELGVSLNLGEVTLELSAGRHEAVKHIWISKLNESGQITWGGLTELK